MIARQVAADSNAIREAINWLKEQDTYQVILWNDSPISVTAPNFVEMEVVETDPRIERRYRARWNEASYLIFGRSR